MRFRLTPREAAFYDLFAGSAAHIVTGARLLGELLAVPPADRPDVARRMRETEHAGDEATHRIMQQLNSSFVTPFDREDIYRLAGSLDDVLDHMEAAADLVVLYQLDGLPPELSHVVGLLQQAAALTADAMPRLRTMADLHQYWVEVNRLENEADRIYRELLAKLFSGSYEPLTVLKLKDVVEELEAAADAFEQVANSVETIAVKES